MTRTISQEDAAAREGRLTARPHTPARTANPGLTPLGLGGRRDGLLFVPQRYRSAQPAPFVLLLHGAGGQARGTVNMLLNQAETQGVVLLAVDSRGRTWDVILGQYGPDVQFINQALEHVFQQCAIDPARLAVGGFSDGASYALSLGIINGDLFSHVLAFSPGFMAPLSQNGEPQIYISHGTGDEVLPIQRCSHKLVPQLQQAGYSVRYHEFDGPHTVPREIADEGVAWLVGQ